MAGGRTRSHRSATSASTGGHPAPKLLEPATQSAQAAAIEDYALIGDCHSAALVSKAGSIDWLCWPRFDSPACFAAILGRRPTGAGASLRRAPRVSVTRRYRPGTDDPGDFVETASGTAALIDFMAVRQKLGRAHCRGAVRHGGYAIRPRTTLRVRVRYPWVTRLNHGSGIRAVVGPEQVVLHSDIKLHGKAMTTVASFTTEAGKRARFVLSHAASHLDPPVPPAADRALEDAEALWSEWSSRCTYRGSYSAEVNRSLLTLKALSYQPTGGIVAAPTTSLPEQPGGARNWDYRFCWLRDATFTLIALMHAGYREEAQAWGAWLRRSVAGSPTQLQTLYGLAGERWVQEWEVPWLTGYQGASPVRIGNAASTQLQLDVYGELLDALYQETSLGLVRPSASWDLQRALMTHLEAIWEQPDESIWEVRGGAQNFTFSKVMAWVAVDRAIRGAEAFGLPAPLERWRALRTRIHEVVCENGFNIERDSFVQYFGGDTLDASLLLLPLVGFLPPEDRRIRSTLAAIESDLMVDGLILRYHTHETADGLTGSEGVFLACSFWFVDNLTLQGRYQEAREMFGRLLGLCNDVGLLAEEYEPAAKRQLGNFPQAFSHLALINAALNLDSRDPPADQRRQAAQTANPGDEQD